MYVKKEIDFNDLLDLCWSGAINTLEEVDEAGMGDSLMMLLEEMCDDTPDIGYINDILWFESDFIFEHLGLDEDGNVIKEGQDFEDVEDSVAEMKSTDEFETFCNDRDCDMCILNYCKEASDCKEEFENYWNQVTDIEDIIDAWKDEFEV